MTIATVKEIKNGEGRVALTPYGADALVKAGHKVLVEKGAGVKSGFSNEAYKKVGAEIIPQASIVYKKAEMIIKVKEPQEQEFKFYRPGLILYTYLHLAAEPKVTKMLLEKKVTAIAYETIELADHSLPLLRPMSEVAGRMAVQIGAWFLQKPNGGVGKLLSGVPGVMPGNVVILGTGVVATNAAKIAVGMGARVSIFGISLEKLRYLDDIFGGKINTLVSNPLAITEGLKTADLVISGVLVIGAKAPKLITRKMLKTMKKGSVIVDVSIDQGGSTETSKLTYHKNPVYEVDGIIHYCVSNIPGAVPQTSTMALTNVTITYALDIANKGLKKAIKEDENLAKGVNTINGKCTYKPVAQALNLPYFPLEEILK
ncbi:MAG: alanine dehydrogenase [Candidatus Levybacteria bacterium]|nr:alanine dehydrogenase [Candidatus Levybacteria bacterium]